MSIPKIYFRGCFYEIRRKTKTAAAAGKMDARTSRVSTRTYQNYELCKMYPKQSSLYAKIADLYNVTVDYLLTNEEQLIADAAIRGGAKAKREVQTLVSQLGGLFAGGELTENDKDKVMRAINDLYWDAKLKNKKYSSKKK